MPVRSIGLTGGIGSGKSTVAQACVALGAHLIDTDAISRALTAPGGEAIPPLRSHFGAAAIAADGSLDRAWMRDHAFGDVGVRHALEGILHPLIASHTQAQAVRAPAPQPIVFDVPLLVESGRWRHRVDRVLVVDASTERQVERVVQRSGWDPASVERVIAQQASRADRRAAADAVIDNDADGLAALHQQLAVLWARWFST